MKYIIQVISIILGLAVACCGFVLIAAGAYWPWNVDGNIDAALEQGLWALVIFFIAALLVAPERIYKKPTVRIVAFIFGLLLSGGGIVGVWAVLLSLALMERHVKVDGFPQLFAAATVLAFACAATLFVKAFRARRTAVARGEGKSKTAAVLLAVFLSFWTWLYTYREDTRKFWLGLGLSLFGLLLIILTLLEAVGLILAYGIWIWAIVDVARKSKEWYRSY